MKPSSDIHLFTTTLPLIFTTAVLWTLRNLTSGDIRADTCQVLSAYCHSSDPRADRGIREVPLWIGAQAVAGTER
jgi:hypothetical protein